MGHIRHQALVVTSLADRMDKLISKASSIIASQSGYIKSPTFILGPSPEATNGYSTVVICPCGSKLGWPTYEQHTQILESIATWLTESREYEWAQIAYGKDDGKAWIESSL